MDIISRYAQSKEDGAGVATLTKSDLKRDLLGVEVGNTLSHKKGDGAGVYIYKTKLKRILEQAIKTGLNSLKRNNHIEWYYTWVVVRWEKLSDRTTLTDSNIYGYSYQASEDEVKILEELTEEFCKYKGCSRQKMWRDYYNEYTTYIADEIKTAFGHVNAYREYIIYIKDTDRLKADAPQDEMLEERKLQFRDLLDSTMRDIVFEKDYKKWSKGIVEKFKKENPELYELCYSDMEEERAVLFDDYSNAMPVIEQLHNRLFGEPLIHFYKG